MFHQAPTAQFSVGSIGWEDEDEYVFYGDDQNDGHTLIRCQLFAGRDPTKSLSDKRAQGTKLICQLNAMGGFRIPVKDARCYIAIPAGMEQTPGAGIIMGTVEPSRSRFDNNKSGDQVFGAAFGEGRVIVKNDGSVTLFTTSNNAKDGKSVFIRVAPDGITWTGPWGTLRFDAAGFHVLTASGASLGMGGIGLPPPLDTMIGSYAKLSAQSVNLEASNVSMGVVAGVPDSLAGSLEVITVLTSLQAEITQLLTYLGVLTATAVGAGTLATLPTPPTSPYGVLTTAITAAAAANVAAELLIPKAASST